MTDICLIFEVHQPLRMNRNFHLDLLSRPSVTKDDLSWLYFDNNLNKNIFERAARKCYLPANMIILNEIQRFKYSDKPFKVSFGISGVFLEQCKQWNPQLLDSFKKLADTGCVEFLEETYYHSLASLFGIDKSEFIEQVKMHNEIIRNCFNQEPEVFENTECIYNNSIAKTISELGYKGIITEGVKRILSWRSPNYIYKAKDTPIKVLLRNYNLSDDIGFRFSSRWWNGWPLNANKYSSWIAGSEGQAVTIFIDYETFGEHHWPESGIHDFLKWLPEEVAKWTHLNWRTPSEVVKLHEPIGEIDVGDFNTVSWADLERDTSAWISNPMQKVSFEFLKALEQLVKALNDNYLLRLWRYFQMSDHLYYMSIKGGGPGDVHSYFNPYGNAIEAFVSFSNVISDFEARLFQELQKPELAATWILRRLPKDRGFTFFFEFFRPTNITSCDLFDFIDALKHVPTKSLEYHIERSDFEMWLSHVIGDKKLAERIAAISKKNLRGETLRSEIVLLVETRVRQLDEIKRRRKG